MNYKDPPPSLPLEVVFHITSFFPGIPTPFPDIPDDELKSVSSEEYWRHDALVGMTQTCRLFRECFVNEAWDSFDYLTTGVGGEEDKVVEKFVAKMDYVSERKDIASAIRSVNVKITKSTEIQFALFLSKLPSIHTVQILSFPQYLDFLQTARIIGSKQYPTVTTIVMDSRALSLLPAFRNVSSVVVLGHSPSGPKIPDDLLPNINPLIHRKIRYLRLSHEICMNTFPKTGRHFGQPQAPTPMDDEIWRRFMAMCVWLKAFGELEDFEFPFNMSFDKVVILDESQLFNWLRLLGQLSHVHKVHLYIKGDVYIHHFNAQVCLAASRKLLSDKELPEKIKTKPREIHLHYADGRPVVVMDVKPGSY